jgi:hypothetical protein
MCALQKFRWDPDFCHGCHIETWGHWEHLSWAVVQHQILLPISQRIDQPPQPCSPLQYEHLTPKLSGAVRQYYGQFTHGASVQTKVRFPQVPVLCFCNIYSVRSRISETDIVYTPACPPSKACLQIRYPGRYIGFGSDCPTRLVQLAFSVCIETGK